MSFQPELELIQSRPLLNWRLSFCHISLLEINVYDSLTNKGSKKTSCACILPLLERIERISLMISTKFSNFVCVPFTGSGTVCQDFYQMLASVDQPTRTYIRRISWSGARNYFSVCVSVFAIINPASKYSEFGSYLKVLSTQKKARTR